VRFSLLEKDSSQFLISSEKPQQSRLKKIYGFDVDCKPLVKVKLVAYCDI
jgi:hypothetical protein